MDSHDKKINNLFIYWLTTSLILVFLIIIVGGLTRLTDSGLSITEWELFKGVFPPTDQDTWNLYFDLYKKIPQYRLLNDNMSLDQFKIIFYWEYFHRFLARFIGLFFLIPLLYFYFIKKINHKYLKICYLIFSLILIQGVVGWYMVQSGLVSNVSVSHYRLSIHLTIAFFIISILFWLIINIKNKTSKVFFNLISRNLPYLFLLILIFLQIVLGAFVSGLDAGRIYQTWPLMGHSFFPNDLDIKSGMNFLNFDNHSLVQFYHRNLAYLLTIYILGLTFYIYKRKIKHLYNSLKLILLVLLVQITLGIFTLVSGLNIYLASAHQISSVILVFSAINLYYFHTK